MVCGKRNNLYMIEGRVKMSSKVKTKLRQMMSFFTAFVLLFSTIASSVSSIKVNAADTGLDCGGC